MSVPRVLLCFCLLVLACTVVGQDEDPEGTLDPLAPRQEGNRLSQMQSKLKELMTKTRNKWESFWSPEGFQGFVQTYYDDHLRGLGTRTRAWFRSSKDTLLDKAHSLCPQLLCGPKDLD
ncbi:apolipoprotein C-IV [Echinops telfairi]|uniref:Apolipoprotein C-IV n=1 Tax=Echinops telfairi TaxID=9371 RepID=A0AC55DAZ6_ECHTE|nr:apolipoprotein C-IV [Echinops telfairi]